MGANVVWLSAIVLEAVVLCRGIIASLTRRHPFFYIYLACILATELVRFYCYEFAPKYYQGFFWNTELLTIAASYIVILEIFRSSFKHHPGMGTLVQRVLLTVFVLVISYAATDLLHGGLRSLPRAIAELGRDLRYAEGAVLLLLLWFFGRHRIALGRNLLGLVAGYSFWIGFNVMNLALFFVRGNEFSTGLRKLLPVTYVVTLSIWCVTLWSAHPEPERPALEVLDHEYQTLATRTRLLLARASTRLARTVRP